MNSSIREGGGELRRASQVREGHAVKEQVFGQY